MFEQVKDSFYGLVSEDYGIEFEDIKKAEKFRKLVENANTLTKKKNLMNKYEIKYRETNIEEDFEDFRLSFLEFLSIRFTDGTFTEMGISMVFEYEKNSNDFQLAPYTSIFSYGRSMSSYIEDGEIIEEEDSTEGDTSFENKLYEMNIIIQGSYDDILSMAKELNSHKKIPKNSKIAEDIVHNILNDFSHSKDKNIEILLNITQNHFRTYPFLTRKFQETIIKDVKVIFFKILVLKKLNTFKIKQTISSHKGIDFILEDNNELHNISYKYLIGIDNNYTISEKRKDSNTLSLNENDVIDLISKSDSMEEINILNETLVKFFENKISNNDLSYTKSGKTLKIKDESIQYFNEHKHILIFDIFSNFSSTSKDNHYYNLSRLLYLDNNRNSKKLNLEIINTVKRINEIILIKIFNEVVSNKIDTISNNKELLTAFIKELYHYDMITDSSHHLYKVHDGFCENVITLEELFNCDLSIKLDKESLTMKGNTSVEFNLILTIDNTDISINCQSNYSQGVFTGIPNRILINDLKYQKIYELVSEINSNLQLNAA